MTDKQEAISALNDEQWDDQALEALLSDPELQDQWARHHRVKDAIQGEDILLADSGFAARVSAAIESEPTLLAPQTKATHANAPGKVVTLFRQFGQYAIAATVAAVAIVGVQQLGHEEVSEAPLPVLNTNPVLGVSATPVSLNTAPPARQPVMMQQYQSRERLIEQKRRINAYFQDHALQQRIQQTEPATETQQLPEHEADSGR